MMTQSLRSLLEVDRIVYYMDSFATDQEGDLAGLYRMEDPDFVDGQDIDPEAHLVTLRSVESGKIVKTPAADIVKPDPRSIAFQAMKKAVAALSEETGFSQLEIEEEFLDVPTVFAKLAEGVEERIEELEAGGGEPESSYAPDY